MGYSYIEENFLLCYFSGMISSFFPFELLWYFYWIIDFQMEFSWEFTLIYGLLEWAIQGEMGENDCTIFF